MTRRQRRTTAAATAASLFVTPRTDEPIRVAHPRHVEYRVAVMLAELLQEERVQLGLATTDKDAAMLAIASLLTAPEETVNAETVYEVLLERERLASTGVGSGVAIPHGRCDHFDELRAAVAVLRDGVDFDAVDGLPVQIVVGIIGPKSLPQKHLAALAGVSRVLRDEATREALLAAEDSGAAYRILVSPR